MLFTVPSTLMVFIQRPVTTSQNRMVLSELPESTVQKKQTNITWEYLKSVYIGLKNLVDWDKIYHMFTSIHHRRL